MPTSIGSIAPERLPLRLRISTQIGRDSLDGGWWPQTRDLAVELADLVDHFPPEQGRIVRALYSPPDWNQPPRRIPVAGRYVKVGCFPRDDTHLIDLTLSDRTVLRVLVVPPELSADQGQEALLAAATPGNGATVESVLTAASDSPHLDPADQWTDDGRSWWHPHPTAPSYRTES